MVLILSKNDLKQVLSMEETIKVLEEAFKEQANGGVIAPDRTTVSFTEDDGWIGDNASLHRKLGGIFDENC